MDAIDWKILGALDRDPRIPTTRLAKAVRVSQQVVDYRLKRLIANGAITACAAIINLKAMGQEHYRIFFTCNARKTHTQDKVFAYLKRQPGTYWAARVGGRYDLLVTLFVHDFEQFDRFIDGFHTAFPGLIKGYESCYGVEHRLYRHKYLHPTTDAIVSGYNDALTHVGTRDQNILRTLARDCRTSALAIARDVHASAKTVINRTKALERQKVILGYRIFLDARERKPYVILLSFKDYTRVQEQRLLSRLGAETAVTQVVRLFGRWNACVHVRAPTDESTQELLIALRENHDIIDEHEIIPVFEDISINLLPGV